jgi:hypothetical protein
MTITNIEFELDREPQSGQTKDYQIIGIGCFSTKLAALWSKSKDLLAWKQDNVSE